MNPFLLEPRERLTDWKKFRIDLALLSEAEQLNAVARYWGQAPLCRFAYDAEDPKSWPTMWEMISDGTWCDRSVAIGMEQTLRFVPAWASDRLALVLVKDHDLHDIKFVVEVDRRLWLNYEYSEVVDVPSTNYDILCAWQFGGKAYKDYTHIKTDI